MEQFESVEMLEAHVREALQNLTKIAEQVSPISRNPNSQWHADYSSFVSKASMVKQTELAS
jgi:hypothetical protein